MGHHAYASRVNPTVVEPCCLRKYVHHTVVGPWCTCKIRQPDRGRASLLAQIRQPDRGWASLRARNTSTTVGMSGNARNRYASTEPEPFREMTSSPLHRRCEHRRYPAREPRKHHRRSKRSRIHHSRFLLFHRANHELGQVLRIAHWGQTRRPRRFVLR